jgi:hypothetical protein
MLASMRAPAGKVAEHYCSQIYVQVHYYVVLSSGTKKIEIKHLTT